MESTTQFRMKLIISIMICILFLYSCSNVNSSSKKQNENSLSLNINMEQTDTNGPYLYIKGGNKCDFGTVNKKKTDVIPININIENTGNAPLVIYKADVSCGCLSVEYDNKPIQPGKTAILNIKINMKEQKGYFNKTVFLNSNATNDVKLIRITGQIK